MTMTAPPRFDKQLEVRERKRMLWSPAGNSGLRNNFESQPRARRNENKNQAVISGKLFGHGAAIRFLSARREIQVRW